MREVKYLKEYNDWVSRPVRQFDFRMEFNGGELTVSDISSIKIHSDLLTGDTFEIGSSVGETIEFDVFMDSDTVIDKYKRIRPYISLYTEVEIDGVITPVWQEVGLGVFKIDPDGVIKKGLNTVTIKASSLLYHPEMGNETYYPSNSIFNSETGFTTSKAVMDDICDTFGLLLSFEDVWFYKDIPEVPIHKENITGMTYREAINYIALLFGLYAKVTDSHRLRFFSLPETDYVFDTDKYMSLTKADETLTIKGFMCSTDGRQTENGKTVISVGSGSPSQIMKITCADMSESLLNELFNRYEGFSYSPIKCKIFGNPLLEVGDIIKVKDIKGNTHIMPIQRITCNITGSGITMDIESLFKVENISSGSSVRKAISELNQDIIQTKLLIAEEFEAINASIENLTVNRIEAVELTVNDLTVTGEANIKELDNAKKDITDLKNNKADKTELGETNTALSELTKKVTTNEGNISNNTKEIDNIKKGYVTNTELGNKADKTDLHSHNNKDVLDGISSDNITSWNNKSEFSGSYNNLTDKPDIPSIEGLASEQYVKDQISALNIASLLERIAALEAMIEPPEGEN